MKTDSKPTFTQLFKEMQDEYAVSEAASLLPLDRMVDFFIWCLRRGKSISAWTPTESDGSLIIEVDDVALAWCDLLGLED